jgi:hypothetical protein
MGSFAPAVHGTKSEDIDTVTVATDTFMYNWICLRYSIYLEMREGVEAEGHPLSSKSGSILLVRDWDWGIRRG